MEKQTLITTKIGKWDAIVSLEEKTFSIVYNGRGGAAVSGNSYKEAEKKFIRAMRLFELVRKFRR